MRETALGARIPGDSLQDDTAEVAPDAENTTPGARIPGDDCLQDTTTKVAPSAGETPPGARIPDVAADAAADAALLRLAEAVRDTGYVFTTPSPATIARVNARPDVAWAHDLRGVFGWSRPFRDGVVPAGLVALMRAAGVLGAYPGGARSLVRLSSLHGALFLHSAYPTTDADAVFFGPDTYRFLDAVLADPVLRAGHPSPARAVDIGCGAGPGAVLLARAWPQAEVIGVDINERALRLTRVNAALAGVPVRAVRSDLLAALDGGFDLIVANPPYLVDPGLRTYRHGGGPLGAGLSLAILERALPRLNPGGTLLLYTGAAIVDGTDPFRQAALARLAGQDAAWTYREIDPDVFGEELDSGPYVEVDRIAAVLLRVTRGTSGHA